MILMSVCSWILIKRNGRCSEILWVVNRAKEPLNKKIVFISVKVCMSNYLAYCIIFAADFFHSLLSLIFSCNLLAVPSTNKAKSNKCKYYAIAAITRRKQSQKLQIQFCFEWRNGTKPFQDHGQIFQSSHVVGLTVWLFNLIPRYFNNTSIQILLHNVCVVHNTYLHNYITTKKKSRKSH